ncbi:MAG: hypothetical protein IKZ59_00995 [Clostridia bacterium]|nr:hypothetical protein [Clostridia bacterium]
MRKKLCLLPLLFAAFLFLTAFKGGNGFSIETGDEYAVATNSSDVGDVAERLGMKEKEVTSYFTGNSLVFIAVSKDKKTQIRISRFEDDFSRKVYDTEKMSDEQIIDMMSLYSESSGVVKAVESGGRKFARTMQVSKDEGGKFTATQYVTVASGQIYIITCYNPGVGASEEVNKIFSSFSVNDISATIDSYSAQKKWLIPAIIAVFAVVVVCAVSLCLKLYEK